jgi:hypothetical protein
MQVTVSNQSVLLDAMIRARTLADTNRPAGLHLSTILDDYFRTLYPHDFGDERPGKALPVASKLTFQELGNLYEDLVAGAFMARYLPWTKPEPKRHAGVWCSPDGIGESRKGRGLAIHEMKACWKSSVAFTNTSKWLRYVYQVGCYCYVWGYSRAEVHVWHVNGNWKPPLPTVAPMTYAIRFEPGEPREYWRRVMQHARDRKLLK